MRWVIPASRKSYTEKFSVLSNLKGQKERERTGRREDGLIIEADSFIVHHEWTNTTTVSLSECVCGVLVGTLGLTTDPYRYGLTDKFVSTQG